MFAGARCPAQHVANCCAKVLYLHAAGRHDRLRNQVIAANHHPAMLLYGPAGAHHAAAGAGRFSPGPGGASAQEMQPFAATTAAGLPLDGSSLFQDMHSPPLPAHQQYSQQQQQQQVPHYQQQPGWPSAAGLMPGAMHGSGSYHSSSSNSSPPPWMQQALQQQQQQQQPSYGVASMLQQQPFNSWGMPQQQLQQQQATFGAGAPQWPGSLMPGAGAGAAYDSPLSHTTTAVGPAFHSFPSPNSHSPGSISPGRGFQAGATTAAALAAMQAAAAGAPFAQQQQQQQWSSNDYSRSLGGLAALGGFGPAESFGATTNTAAAAAGIDAIGSNNSSSSSPPRGRGAQDNKARKDAYRAELEAQIRERAAHKAAEKSRHAVQEARKEAEMAAYCPWGRGGAGAPLRDAAGQVWLCVCGHVCVGGGGGGRDREVMTAVAALGHCVCDCMLYGVLVMYPC